MIAIDHAGRRCEERCHDAKDPQCDCVCGGALHGTAHQPGGVLAAIRKSRVRYVQLDFIAELNSLPEILPLNSLT